MKTRNGKIAHLSRALRDQLNQRLADGEQGPKLLRWLNRLPEVQSVMAEAFDGQPINSENLSQWRAGGFQDWLTRQEALEQARELASDAAEMKAATTSQSGHCLSDHLATLLTIRCAKVLTNWDSEASEELERQLRALRGMVQGIASLERVSVERQRLESIREKSQAELVDLFNAWLELPAVREAVAENRLDPEERKRILAEVYGRPYSPPETPKTKAPITQTQYPADKSPKPAEAPGASASGTPLASAFGPDPLKSKSARQRWLKDPTAYEPGGSRKSLTAEERQREIDRIYGRVEQGEFKPAKPVEIGESLKPEPEPVSETNHPSPSVPLPVEGRGKSKNPARHKKSDPAGKESSTPVSAPNQSESGSIKPIGPLNQPTSPASFVSPKQAGLKLRVTVSKNTSEEDADRQWRLQHGFETEVPPGGS